MKQLRFGTYPHFSAQKHGKNWIKYAQKVEKLGYSTLMYPDHIPNRTLDPITLLASAAAVTKTLNIGTLVFDVDFRHPAILAKTAATLHLLSEGRFEFGIGAGHDPNDYTMIGIPFDPPSVRIRRLEEALQIIKSMWTQEKTTFHGKHYSVNDIEKAAELPIGECPKIIVGGGGKKLLKVAGRHADIVGIHVNLHDKTKKGVAHAARNQDNYEKINERISWVKNSAEAVGRDPDEIEFQMMSGSIKITDDPESVMKGLVDSYSGFLSYDDLCNHPRVFVGSASHIRDKILRLRKETGISYIVLWSLLSGNLLEDFSKFIIKPLSK